MLGDHFSFSPLHKKENEKSVDTKLLYYNKSTSGFSQKLLNQPENFRGLKKKLHSVSNWQKTGALEIVFQNPENSGYSSQLTQESYSSNRSLVKDQKSTSFTETIPPIFASMRQKSQKSKPTRQKNVSAVPLYTEAQKKTFEGSKKLNFSFLQLQRKIKNGVYMPLSARGQEIKPTLVYVENIPTINPLQTAYMTSPFKTFLSEVRRYKPARTMKTETKTQSRGKTELRGWDIEDENDDYQQFRSS